jgi:hypothetical protein
VVVGFQSDPVGATVRVDGRLFCWKTPCWRRLTPGPHRATFERRRYSAATEVFTASAGATVRGTLAPRFGWVSVETEPPGIGIAIDGVVIGRSPVAWRDLDEGVAEIEILDPCWERTGQRLPVRAGERRALKLAPRPRVAELKVAAADASGDALDALVRVDGAAVGRAGATLRVPLCAKRVSVALGGETFEADLKLDRGKITTVTARPTRVTCARPVQ